MNKNNARLLIAVALIGAALILFAGPLGDRLGGLNKRIPELQTNSKSEDKTKSPLPVLRLKREVLKAPPSAQKEEEFKLPQPKVTPKNGALTNQEIEDAISNRQPLFQRCWTQRLHDSPNLTGRTLLQFEITPRGKVQSVQVVESTINDDVMLRCLASVLERISFRDFDGGSITLTFPLAFE